MGTKVFRLPDLGEGLTESEIVGWKVSVGQTVALNQVLGEVETAKAVVELPSPFAGRIAALHADVGAVVDVGAPIVTFEVQEEDGGGVPSEEPSSRKAPETRGNGRQPNLVGYGAAAESSSHPVRRRRRLEAVPSAGLAAPQPPPLSAAGTTAVPSPAAEAGNRPRSTPPVRKLARDLGVDLASLRPSGNGGLITREDVLAASAAGRPAAADTPDALPTPDALERPAVAETPAASMPAGERGPRETRIPIQGVRRSTAEAMVRSAFTAPHVTEFLTVDVTAMMELLDALRQRQEFAGLRLSPLTLAAKAVCIALRRHPELNSRWDEAAREIVRFGYVNLGIAAATPRGLMVPNIKDAHDLPLPELASALNRLADTARAGRTQPADLAGGTITITNVGSFGVDAGTPILNPGEAAILALGAVRRMPWEYKGGIELRSVMTLSLSFDHRLVDGEQGSGFLTDVGMILGEPGMVLAVV